MRTPLDDLADSLDRLEGRVVHVKVVHPGGPQSRAPAGETEEEFAHRVDRALKRLKMLRAG